MKTPFYISIILLFPLIVASQNVGIETLTPLEKLQVGDLNGTGGASYIMVGGAGNNTSVSGIKLRHFSDDYGFTIESNDSIGSQGLNIRRHIASSAGVSDLFIDNTGKIGFGTTIPLMKLHISKSDNSLLLLENTEALGEGVNTSMYFKTGNGFYSYTGGIKTIGTGSELARLGFFTYAATSPNGLLERMSILDNGNVGIGLLSPSAKLEVEGGIKADSIDVQSGLIKNVADPISAQDAATKAYVDLISSPCGLSIGDNYAGGMIFYLDASGCHGLVAAASDQSTGIQWYNGSYVDTYAYGNGIGAGEGNSQGIRRWQGTCSSCYASELCQDLSLGGYSDWYLPSKYELNLMYENIGQGNSLGLGNVGGFSSDFYWSSTENDFNYAWGQSFNSGSQNDSVKHGNNFVRAVRAF